MRLNNTHSISYIIHIYNFKSYFLNPTISLVNNKFEFNTDRKLIRTESIISYDF